MFEHLRPHHTAVPRSRGAGSDPDRPRSRLLSIPTATAFVATLVVIALAIISALTLLATTPEGVAVPATMLLIGGLVAASLAVRARVRLEGSARPRSAHPDLLASPREAC